MTRRGKRWISLVCWAAALVLMAALIAGVASAARVQRREAANTLRESIVRAAVCCYAIEGRYPASVADLETRYGVHVGEGFLVYYEVFADNIMPYVEVRAQ